MRQQSALERALASPDDVRREVIVSVLGQARRDARVYLWLLAGQHEQLLDVALGRTVKDLGHLLGRVQVRMMLRDRAVLAAAPAGPRQRECRVAREAHSPSHGWSL